MRVRRRAMSDPTPANRDTHTRRRSWTQLMQGTSTVIDAMDAWKHESLFGDFIAESSTFPTAPPSPAPDHRPSQPRDEDLAAYQRTLEQVQKVEAHLKRNKEETTQVQHLIGFLKGARKISPTLSIAGQYKVAEDLRRHPQWGNPVQVALVGDVLNITRL